MASSELTISALGREGDGISKSKKGFIYIDRAVPGDRLRVRYRPDRQGILRGDILGVIEPSTHRQTPPCPHYEGCGNCTFQHLKLDYYRRWKENLVRDLLFQYDLRPKEWLPTEFIGEQTRRRLTFVVTKQRGKIEMGYYGRRSQKAIAIESCLIADPKLWALRSPLKLFLARVLKEGGEPIHLFLQLIQDQIEMVITGYPLRIDSQFRNAFNELPIQRLSWRAEEGEESRILLEKKRIFADFGPLKVELPLGSFLQPTLDGERALVKAVMSALPAADPKIEKVADLFSGCGTFTGPLLTKSAAVDAFENSSGAVKALQKAKGDLSLHAIRRDLFRQPLRRHELNRYDAVVFDPPRAGCSAQAREMAGSKVGTLIGVSCNPKSFAQDAALLRSGGYRFQSIKIIDQFPWSHHVELVGLFRR